ncbi:MAG: DUF177 domain-containing protein [Actinomycetota bacterium]|nr:DUF177 domain-containing protein [Actinomycetota bacterium]
MAELIIDVSDLLRELGKELEIKMSKEFSPLNLGTREVKFAKPVDLNLTLENVDSGVLAQGTAEGTLILQCNRCLKEFACPMKVKIEEIFCHPSKSQELEESETFPIMGERVDLAPVIEQAFLLVIPMKVLCNPKCKGLCPICGKNLNEGMCDCSKQEINSRFLILKKLLKK